MTRKKAGSGNGRAGLAELLDDDISDYTLSEWRARNLTFFDLLVERELIDLSLVSREAHRYLTDALIQVRVGAATDSQNAGHVRAQNENVVLFALAAGVSKETLTISLEAGFIHDLNKAIGEPLRSDDFAVRDDRGRAVPVMTTMAQIVGLNHLGERTRRTLMAATRISQGALAPELAERIDRCIIHHGLGSSRFIRDLVDGKNPWWGSDFVDPANGTRRLIHPAQPELTLESIIHDLADSTQQMQGGLAWLMKYPAGFWRASGRSYAEMLSGVDAWDGLVPLSLRQQIRVETETCEEIIAQGRARGLIDAKVAGRLQVALADAARSSQIWIDDSPARLAEPEGGTVYHDVASALSIGRDEAHERLLSAVPGTPEGDALEEVIWQSGRRLDQGRARDLAARIED